MELSSLLFASAYFVVVVAVIFDAWYLCIFECFYLNDDNDDGGGDDDDDDNNGNENDEKQEHSFSLFYKCKHECKTN